MSGEELSSVLHLVEPTGIPAGTVSIRDLRRKMHFRHQRKPRTRDAVYITGLFVRTLLPVAWRSHFHELSRASATIYDHVVDTRGVRRASSIDHFRCVNVEVMRGVTWILSILACS